MGKTKRIKISPYKRIKISPYTPRPSCTPLNNRFNDPVILPSYTKRWWSWSSWDQNKYHEYGSIVRCENYDEYAVTEACKGLFVAGGDLDTGDNLCRKCHQLEKLKKIK